MVRNFGWILFSVAALPVLRANVPGTFPPPAGQPGSNAISAADARFLGWATGVASFSPGPDDVSDPMSFPVDYGTGASALGPADILTPQNQPAPGDPGPYPAVSLGDGGSITLRFSPAIADGPGPDLAVFENGLNDEFLELAFVEVSSDGAQFVRFPAVSCTPVTQQVGSFSALDARNLSNLAGKYRAGWGTPFDLGTLPAQPSLNKAAITHVRLIDVVGSIDPLYGRRDSLGQLINDPFPTPYASGGFDLDAVGVLHQSVTSYAGWRGQFTWTQSAPNDDPDQDGVSNLMEYAFATNPLQSNAAPAIMLTRSPSGLTAHFPAARTSADLIVGVQTSADLRTWSAPVALAPLTLAGRTRFCRLHMQLREP